MEVNEIQIGGDHYRKKYQHWDFVCDTEMPYLLGCATKYVARHQDKNGIEDLQKAIHYLSKAEDRGIYMPRNKWYEFITFDTTDARIDKATRAFCSQLGEAERHIIVMIVNDEYQAACDLIAELIDDTVFGEPGAGYTNQDPDWFRG